MQKTFLLAAALLLGACQAQVDPSAIPCSSDGNCPTGSFCSGGKCAALPGQHDVTVDAAAPVTAGKTLKLSVHSNGGVTFAVQEASGGTVDADGTYHAPTTPGTYHVVVTSTADPSKSATVAITVAPVPQVPVIQAAAVSTVNKQRLAASVTSAASIAGLTFTWSITGGSLTSADIHAAAVEFRAGTGASLTLSCTATNAAGDVSAAGTLVVQLVPAPDATLTSPAFVTRGKSGYTGSVPAQADSTFTWTVTHGNVTAGDGTNSITFASTGGLFPTLNVAVHVVNKAGDFADSSSSSGVVDPVAAFTVAGDLLTNGAVRSGQQAGAHVVPPSQGGVTFSWTISGTALFTNGATGNSVSYVGGAAGSATLVCAGTNQAGDTSTATLPVTVVGSVFASGATAFMTDKVIAVADGVSIVNGLGALADVNGKPVFADALTITAVPSTGVVIGGAGVTSNADGTWGLSSANDGTFSFTITATKAVSTKINVGVEGLVLAATISFVPGVAVKSHSTLTTDKTTVVADTVSVANLTANIATLTATVVDQFSNPISGAPVQFLAAGSNNTLFGNANATTGASGVATTTLSSVTAEIKTVTATVGPAGNSFTLALPGPGTITVRPADADPSMTSLVRSTADLVAADNSATIGFTVTTKDTFGNFAPATTLTTITTDGANDILSATSGATLASATFAFTLKTQTAALKTVTVNVKRTMAGTTFPVTATSTFVAGTPEAGHSSLATTATSLIASSGASASTLTATVADKFGNPVTGASVLFQAAPTTGNTFGTANATTVNGLATSTFYSTIAEAKTVTALVGGSLTLSLPVPGTITVGPADAAPSKTTLVRSSADSVVADNSATIGFTVTTKDTFGNLAPNTALPTITTDGARDILSATSGTTNGSAVFGLTLKTKTAETKTVTVNAKRASDGTTFAVTALGSFVFGPPAPAPHSTFTSDVTNVGADGVAKATLTTTVKDQFDNLVSGAAVGYSSVGTSNTFVNQSGTTGGNGVFVGSISSTLVHSNDPVSSRVNFGSPSQFSILPDLAITFVVGDPDLTQTQAAFTKSADNLTADGSAASTITLIVKDAAGHPIPNLTGISWSGTVAGDNFAPALVTTTDSNGKIASNFSSIVAAAKVLTATIPRPLAGSPIAPALAITFKAGAPDFGQSSISGGSAPVVANGMATESLSVTIKDVKGNPVPGIAIAFQATDTGATNVFTYSGGLTNTNTAGVVSATMTSTKAEPKTFSALVGTSLFMLTLAPVVAFTPGDPNASKSSFAITSTPPSGGYVADNSAASTVSFLLTAKDTFGNVIAGQTVTITGTGSGNTYSPVATNNVVTALTDINGQRVVTLKTIKAEPKSITASIPNTQSGGSLSLGPVAVTFVVGPPAGSPHSSISGGAGPVVADGTATEPVSVIIKDANDNLISGILVGFAAAPLSATNVFTYAGGATTTNAAGVVSATMTSLRADTKTLSAVVGASVLTLTLVPDVIFVAGDPDLVKSTLLSSPPPSGGFLADNSATSTATITLTAMDINGNLITGQSGVTISGGTSTGNTWTAPGTASIAGNLITGTTDSNGQLVVTLKTIMAEPKIITGSIPKKSGGSVAPTNLPITFNPGPAVSGNTTLGASPASLVADGNTTTTLTLTAKDAQSNLTNISASTISGLGAGDVFGSIQHPSLGVYTVTLKSITASTSPDLVTWNVTPVSGGTSFPKTTSVTFNPGPPSLLHSSLSPTGTSVSTDAGTNTVAFTATFQDANANPLAGKSVTISSTNSGDTFPVSGSTNGSGQVFFNYTSTKAEPKTISVLLGGGQPLTVQATVTYNAGAAVQGNSSFSIAAGPTNGTVLADGVQVFNIKLIAVDANLNLIPGLVVSLTCPGSHNIFSPASGPTGADGSFNATLATYVSGTKSVTATAIGLSFNKSVSASAAPWQQAANIYGAHVTGIAFDAITSATVYASSQTGVMRSTDSGANWTLVNNGMERLRALAVSSNLFNSVSVVVALATPAYNSPYTSSTIYRSTDNGNTWTSIALPGAAGFIVAGGTGVFLTDVARSTDGGQTWSAIALSGGGAITLVGAAWNGSIFYALATGAAGPEVVKSSDNGLTWSAANTVVRCAASPQAIVVDTAAAPQSIYYYCANGSTLYKSVDSGATFTAVAASLVNSSGTVLSTDPLQSNRLIWGDSSGEFYESVDGGATSTGWKLMTLQYGSVRSTAAVIDPTNHNKVWLGFKGTFTWGNFTPGVVTALPNAGTYTVTTLNRGMPGAGTDQVLWTKSSVAYTYANGIYSSNDGITWTPFPAGLPPITPPSGATISVAGGGPNNAPVYVMSNGGGPVWWNTLSGTPTTWTSIPFPPGVTSGYYSVAADPNFRSNVYAYGYTGSGYSLFSSSNQGIPWGSPIAFSAPNALPDNVATVQVSPINFNTVWVTGYYNSGQRVVKVLNASLWNQVNVASLPTNLALDPSTDGVAYAVVGKTLVKISGFGAGTSIILATPANFGSFAVDRNGTTFYGLAGDSNNSPTFYRSTDSGATWTTATSGLLYSSVNRNSNITPGPSALAASPLTSGLVLVATERGGIFYTTTGGQ